MPLTSWGRATFIATLCIALSATISPAMAQNVGGMATRPSTRL